MAADCYDHVEMHWSCRRCVAALILNTSGPLSFLVAPTREGSHALADDMSAAAPGEVASRVEGYADDVPVVAVFVKVARWSQKPEGSPPRTRDF